MRVDIFNTRYALPSLLQAFPLALAWIRIVYDDTMLFFALGFFAVGQFTIKKT